MRMPSSLQLAASMPCDTGVKGCRKTRGPPCEDVCSRQLPSKIPCEDGCLTARELAALKGRRQQKRDSREAPRGANIYFNCFAAPCHIIHTDTVQAGRVDVTALNYASRTVQRNAMQHYVSRACFTLGRTHG